MDKSILQQYIDACALVEETEMAIKRLEKLQEKIVVDSVRGSMPDFPYAAQTFKIEGLSYETIISQGKLDEQIEILKQRQEAAACIKLQVEAWLNTIPLRMQRIIRYAVFEGDTWEEVARKMGRKTTADSLKQEYSRFLRGI